MPKNRRDNRPSDPWPTLEDAIREATVVARYARAFYRADLKAVWLYGSRARGDNRPDSDLDVLLVRDPPNGLDPIHVPREWADEPFRDMLEEHMDGYSEMFTPIQIKSVQPDQLETWDTMFFRSVREDGIRIV